MSKGTSCERHEEVDVCTWSLACGIFGSGMFFLLCVTLFALPVAKSPVAAKGSWFIPSLAASLLRERRADDSFIFSMLFIFSSFYCKPRQAILSCLWFLQGLVLKAGCWEVWGLIYQNRITSTVLQQNGKVRETEKSCTIRFHPSRLLAKPDSLILRKNRATFVCVESCQTHINSI